MNELQIFKNDLFGEVRTVLLNNEVWFVLIDICKALGLTNPSMVALRLDEDEVTKFDLGSLSGITNIVNESGLYKVIFRSDKKEVKPFTKWVTNEILPSVRKHGMYATDELLSNPDLFIKVATRLKEEKEKNIFLQSENKQQEKRINHLEPWANYSKAYFYKKFNNIPGGSLENK